MDLIKAEQLCDIAEQQSLYFKHLLKSSDEPDVTAYTLVLQSIYRRMVNAVNEGDYFLYVPVDLFVRAERAVAGARFALPMMKRIRNELLRQHFQCKFAPEAQHLYISWG